TDNSTYAYPATINVLFSNMLGVGSDFVTIAPAGSSASTETRYAYTGPISGTKTFTGILPGTYVARAYFANGNTIQGESASFTITGSANPTVSTDKASYGATDSVVVSWSNFPGYYNDYVTIEPAGSPPVSELRYAYTKGVASGSTSFSGLPTGT